MTIKMIARRNWHEGEEKAYDTWYRPFDEQRYITAATAWLLNGHPEITGLATAGETRLLQQMIVAERERADLTPEAAAAILEEVHDSRITLRGHSDLTDVAQVTGAAPHSGHFRKAYDVCGVTAVLPGTLGDGPVLKPLYSSTFGGCSGNGRADPGEFQRGGR